MSKYKPTVVDIYKQDLKEREERRSLITTDDEICDGEPIVSSTRISVVNIVEAFKLGSNVKFVRESFPHLNDQQILAALEYYEEHDDVIDGLIQEENLVEELLIVDQEASKLRTKKRTDKLTRVETVRLKELTKKKDKIENSLGVLRGIHPIQRLKELIKEITI